jgi:NAD(P)-dependent dehydrogenase (short-subunit alcohol dehydrogenase family)
MTIALVTGGAQGLGRAVSEAFGREGASVVVVDVNLAGAQETAGLVRVAGGEATATTCDVTSSDDVARAVALAVSTYGRLDCAVNNAAVSLTEKPLAADIAEADWRRIIDVNLTGVWMGMRHEIPALLDGGGGAIVNISSTAGVVGSSASDAAYSASKHGIIGLTQTAALDYATKGLRINAVCPGPIQTPMFESIVAVRPEVLKLASPMQRAGAPSEIAAAVIWLCSPAASFVTGSALTVDGGYLAR